MTTTPPDEVAALIAELRVFARDCMNDGGIAEGDDREVERSLIKAADALATLQARLRRFEGAVPIDEPIGMANYSTDPAVKTIILYAAHLRTLVARQAVELEDAQREITALTIKYDAVSVLDVGLMRENEGLKKNDARYRWVSHQTTVSIEDEDTSEKSQEAWNIIMTGGNTQGALDAAIDAALAKDGK